MEEFFFFPPAEQKFQPSVIPNWPGRLQNLEERGLFQTAFTYCIEVSLFHDNVLTPECSADSFWASVIMVLNAAAEPRGGCVQSIRLEH